MEKKKSRKGLIIVLVIVAILLIVFIGYLMFSAVPEEEEAEEITTEEEAEAVEEEPEEEPLEEESDELMDRSADTGSGGSWTVMVYMCGSDLESKGEAATLNLCEILSVDDPEKVNVLVETGGCKEWSDEAAKIDPETLGFYSFGEDGMHLEKTEPLRSMGDPENLKDFIAWGRKTRPADKYMIIFWDHGGGSTTGVCFDELYDGDCLTLAELKKAFTEADVPFEVIGFDACLMATLENAEALQGYGHYMIASQELEPGGGWDYTDYLNFLGSDLSMDGQKLGKRIADGFMQKCEITEEDDMSTLSVTDLTRIPQLSAAYRRLSLEMVLSTQDTGNLRKITQGASSAERLGPNTDADGYTNMIDLGDMVKKTESVLNQNADSVTKALENAVIYETHGSSRKDSHGLSVFYPLEVEQEKLDEYKSFANNDAFVGFTNVIMGNWDSVEWEKNWEDAWKEAYPSQEAQEGKYDSFFNGGQSIAADYNEPSADEFYESLSEVTPVEKEKYDLKYTMETDKDGYHHLKITSGLDMVETVNFLLYYEDPDSGKYIYLGSDNSLEADYDKGEFKEDFSGTWITIGGEFVYAELTEENEEYNLYTIPITLNGEDKFLKAVYEFDKEAFRILGAYDGMEEETGHAGRDVKQLKKGDKIEFLFYIYDPDSDADPEMYAIGDIVWSDDMKMEDTEMDDANLAYVFMIRSFFGDEEYVDPIYLGVENGMVVVD